MELYVRSESVVSRVIAGETLIVPIRKGVGDLASIYSLNGVASLIWDVLREPRDSEQIIQVIQSEFSSGDEQVRKDVRGFLQEMCSLGLISSCATEAAV